MITVVMSDCWRPNCRAKSTEALWISLFTIDTCHMIALLVFVPWSITFRAYSWETEHIYKGQVSNLFTFLVGWMLLPTFSTESLPTMFDKIFFFIDLE